MHEISLLSCFPQPTLQWVKYIVLHPVSKIIYDAGLSWQTPKRRLFIITFIATYSSLQIYNKITAITTKYYKTIKNNIYIIYIVQSSRRLFISVYYDEIMSQTLHNKNLDTSYLQTKLCGRFVLLHLRRLQ